jgi:hypothetical protein
MTENEGKWVEHGWKTMRIHWFVWMCLGIFGHPESQFFVANFRANDGEPSTAGAFNFPYLFY